ncbi:MAG: DUF4465 domain-containing protein [Cytophagaceae bacterium]
MKHNYFSGNFRSIILTFLAFSFSIAVHAQRVVSFENLHLEEESYWNGSDGAGGFISGGAFFPNAYNTSWDFWSSGFAYSNMTDVTTPGHGNMYSVFTGSGYEESEIYVIGRNNSTILFPNNPFGVNPQGFYVTNTTYAALSMQEGDDFAKPFGGEDGNDPDWFLLTVTGYRDGKPIEGTIEFYLADYRFEDNSENYIIDEWIWVDLTPLGTVDNIRFNLSSSDVGDFGMNTPAYFALDNFTYNTDVKPRITAASKDQSLEEGQELTLSVTAIGGTLSYQWYKDNLPIENAESSTYTISEVHPLDGGTYHVIVTNVNGSTQSQDIEVHISTSGDPLSVFSQVESSVRIFPNPAKDVLNLTGLSEAGCKITISDIKGQTRITVYADGLNTQIDLHRLQNGLYIITIETEQGNSIHKFLKL